jgi:hypothetical protein
MARSFSLASRQYSAGTYGPFKVDGFVATDTDWLEITFTVESWPDGVPALITGSLRWDTGDGQDFIVNSLPKNRDGSVKPVVAVRIPVPQTATGKAAVTGGNVTLKLAQPIRTALALVAGSNPTA